MNLTPQTIKFVEILAASARLCFPHHCVELFPTSQVTVLGFCVSWPAFSSSARPQLIVVPAGPDQKTQDQSDPRRASTASARSQWSPPDPNRKLKIRVIPAGLQPHCDLHLHTEFFTFRTSAVTSTNLMQVVANSDKTKTWMVLPDSTFNDLTICGQE